jgi:hypothetical protein
MEGRRARAPRYPIEVPVHYRRTGEPSWSDGRSINISASGLLFRVLERGPAPHNHVEVVMELSAGTPGVADVRCIGRIVRTVSPMRVGNSIQAALEFEGYRFARAGRGQKAR